MSEHAIDDEQQVASDRNRSKRDDAGHAEACKHGERGGESNEIDPMHVAAFRDRRQSGTPALPGVPDSVSWKNGHRRKVAGSHSRCHRAGIDQDQKRNRKKSVAEHDFRVVIPDLELGIVASDIFCDCHGNISFGNERASAR
jgi:hypothetical protein